MHMPTVSLFRRITRLLIAAACCSAAAAQVAWPARGAAGHPLDALTAEEITKAVALLRQAGLVDAQTRFPNISLLEPSKAEVLAWQPGRPIERRAFLVVKKAAQTHEGVIDLARGAVERFTHIEGVQPSLLSEEWAAAQQLTRGHPDWQAGMRARGYTSFETIFCEAFSAGYFGQTHERNRRLAKVACYDTSGTGANLYARPIEGLYTTVDLDARTVIDVIDTGAVPINREAHAPDQGTATAPPASAPSANIAIRGSQVAWGDWSFHVRLERRDGPVLSLISYNDHGRSRPVMYRGSVAEMFVPYMDPHVGWSHRSFMDVGEYGFGQLASSLRLGVDCPGDAVLLHPTMPSETGVPYVARSAICVFERRPGAPLWRHAETLNKTYTGAAAVELVVRTIPTVGNYDYVLDWVFTPVGEIRVEVGATGYAAVKGVAAETRTNAPAEAGADTGALVAPNLVAVHHDHFLSFRFDFDVDGPRNSFVREALVTRELPPDSARRSLWALERRPLTTEAGISAAHSPEIWRIINPNVETSLGNAPGYQIAAGHSARSLLQAADWPQRRAAFSAEQLWLTVYDPRDLYAAGPNPTQSRGEDGVPKFANDQSIDDVDFVAWYTMGFHHVTRPEDWPILPTMWHSVSLRPFGFFTRNPSVDLPRSEAGQFGKP